MLSLFSSRASTRRAPTASCLQCRIQQYMTLAASSPFLKISEEVREAVQSKKPVVALETTIYTHGFPHPQNVALAAELESIVRSNGAIPATIGILDGVARVGMSPAELARLTDPQSTVQVLKVSRRDLAFATGARLAGRNFHGGTTIAGTSVLAHLAGIRIFATGGLGGVHRGAESSMDISADLTELGRTPITVVSSGCKSFLDIPRTLEYLETEGVAVATFADGREGAVNFPAFWARDSGVRSPMTVRDEKEAAAVVHAQTSLGLQSGMLFANPIPRNAAIEKAEIDVIIAEAVRVADEQKVTGKDNTPFILDWILKATEGRSIVANRALISSNVRRGTGIAIELAKLDTSGDAGTVSLHKPNMPEPCEKDKPGVCTSSMSTTAHHTAKPDDSNDLGPESLKQTNCAMTDAPNKVVVIGAVAVDISCDYMPFDKSLATEPQSYTSNPASIGQTLGGVGFNIARALHHLGMNVHFMSSVGDDLSGKAVLSGIKTEGMTTRGIATRSGATTAHYVAINDRDKNLHLAMADMRIHELNSAFDGNKMNPWSDVLHEQQQHCSRWVVIDANIAPTALSEMITTARQWNAKIALEPVSAAKAARAMRATLDTPKMWPDNLFDIATPNVMELSTMYRAADDRGIFEDKQWFRVIDALGLPSTGMTSAFKQVMPSRLVEQGLPQQVIKLLPLVPCILVKLGAEGVLLTQLLEKGDPRLREGDAAPFILSRGLNNMPAFGKSLDRMVGGMYMRYFPAAVEVPADDIISVNGVGDTFLGTIIAGLVKHGDRKRLEDLIDLAQKAAVLTLKSRESVSPGIDKLREEL